MEHGNPEQRRRIVATLCGVLWCGTQNRNACHVITTALEYCSAEDRAALVSGLLSGGSDRLAELRRHQFGSDVLRAPLQIPGEGALLQIPASGRGWAVAGQQECTETS